MTDTHTYDIIIENIIREWESSMNNNIPHEKWEIPKYSRKQIELAGKTVASSNTSQQGINDALEILNNWRSSHAYPLQVICQTKN